MRDAISHRPRTQHRDSLNISKVQEASRENTRGNGNTGRAETSSCRELFPLPGGVFRTGCQGKPRGKRGELFVLRPRSAKGAAKLGNSTHQIIALETESLSRAVQEFPLSDSEIAEATAIACMEKSFAKEFTVGSVYQRMGSKNLFQRGECSARGKEQAASCEFEPLFLQLGLKFADRAVSKAPCLILDSFNEFASLPRLHFFCGMIGLAKFVAEDFDEIDALPRQANGCAFFDLHTNQCSQAGMHS